MAKTSKTKTAQPIAVDRKPKPVVELKLTDFQTFVCDRVADLMLRGGHDYDLENLLCAAIGHYYRTMFPRTRMGDCTEQEKERVTKYIDEHLDDWRTKLAREWPRPEDPKQVEPKGVMERVYAFWNSDLRTHLDGFMDEAGSDDKRLLHDILMDWESTKLPADRDDPRAVLATAFASAVDEAHVYFKVPSSIKDLVDGYVRILLEGRDAEPAEAA